MIVKMCIHCFLYLLIDSTFPQICVPPDEASESLVDLRQQHSVVRQSGQANANAQLRGFMPQIFYCENFHFLLVRPSILEFFYVCTIFSHCQRFLTILMHFEHSGKASTHYTCYHLNLKMLRPINNNVCTHTVDETDSVDENDYLVRCLSSVTTFNTLFIKE